MTVLMTTRTERTISQFYWVNHMFTKLWVKFTSGVQAKQPCLTPKSFPVN